MRFENCWAGNVVLSSVDKAFLKRLRQALQVLAILFCPGNHLYNEMQLALRVVGGVGVHRRRGGGLIKGDKFTSYSWLD